MIHTSNNDDVEKMNCIQQDEAGGEEKRRVGEAKSDMKTITQTRPLMLLPSNVQAFSRLVCAQPPAT